MLPKLMLLLATLLFFMSTILFYLNFMIFFSLPILNFSSMSFSASFIMDWMALFFSFSVTSISSMIIMYSIEYIPMNEHKRFFIVLLSFVMSMITLIFSNNLFFMMVGWDGLGLSSYILVIYYQDSKSAESGLLTILSNRIGDIFMIIAIGILISLGSWELFMAKSFCLLSLTMMLLAAMSKSAQTPFSAWLPAAMAAPTPISALVHSSTLVTAGVYISIRLFLDQHNLAPYMILMSSSVTMLFAGMSANWEQDLKKIIALSTLSQIAMMMFSISINSIMAAYFHLITHAFFKSNMFLCAGSIINESSYQDMRAQNYNLSLSSMSVCMGISNMALMGLPFMSGFYSKDMIVEMLLSHNFNLLLVSFILITLGLTASYSIRLTKLSSTFMWKIQKDLLPPLNKKLLYSILILTPISVFMGTVMSWLMFPAQLFLMSFHLKASIITMILLGVTLGMTLSFKKKMMASLGESANSLWYLHMLTVVSPLLLMKKSEMMWILDNSWLEIFSAQGSNSLTSILSKPPSLFYYFKFSLIMMFLLSPILIFSMI